MKFYYYFKLKSYKVSLPRALYSTLITYSTRTSRTSCIEWNSSFSKKSFTDCIRITHHGLDGGKKEGKLMHSAVRSHHFVRCATKLCAFWRRWHLVWLADLDDKSHTHDEMSICVVRINDQVVKVFQPYCAHVIIVSTTEMFK